MSLLSWRTRRVRSAVPRPFALPRRRKTAAAICASVLVVVSLAACGPDGGGTTASSSQSGVLTIGMTAGDVPNLDTILASSQGYEGYRFVGNSLYDGLTRFDLKQGTEIPKVVGGLATSWDIDKATNTWTFHLRSGVTFHDGTPFDADAVIFNFDRYLNTSAHQYNSAFAATAASSAAGIASYRKVDDSTVAITTRGPWSHLDSDLVFLYIASPTAVKAHPKDFSLHPVGTGPFVFSSLARGQQVTFTANPNYWGGAPKVDKLVLKAMPDVATRLAALRSGEVNWIEAPNPDDVAGLKKDGYQVLTNSYDHVWPWIFDLTHKPLDDPRVRRALNLAIDRQTMASTLLDGTAEPAAQLAPRANGAYRAANDTYSYNLTEARKLLAEAGVPNGFSMTVSYPTSGSGNMQPGPMNQQLQSDLARIGVRVQLKPIEWAAMLTSFSSGKIPDGADAINISLTFIQESIWSTLFAPGAPLNVGHYNDPAVGALLTQAQSEYDPTRRNALYAEIVKKIDEQSPWLVVVNDLNPRALAADVHGFVQPKSWFVDLTTVAVNPT
ncbi:peptide/nickel transport system substrate-binding protein [Frankia sp. AiPs1]|uniref:ABC transporter substrate-binding protein n=1 Tax=Frankia sp. AiPa1 TaxID=573492 RepID=UPI00202B28C0|nr:ABC transporter substrate-binding protein [Frankia sp. AiPa1]MCL9759219.1 ABC transporter substrate-binding protein [Frankia sp. AiPa1]